MRPLQPGKTIRPHVLAAFDFHSANPNDPLLEAVDLLKELNSSGGRVVPDGAPTGFATAKWYKHMTRDGGRIDRRAWEMSTLIELRGALRGANAWVDHSRRYQDPLNYLLPDDVWLRLQPEVPAATGISLDPTERLEELALDLDEQLTDLDTAFEDASSVRMDNDRLVVTPPTAPSTTPHASWPQSPPTAATLVSRG